MVSGKGSGSSRRSGRQNPSGGSTKRPHATLDLKADEVKTEEKTSDKQASENKKTSESKTSGSKIPESKSSQDSSPADKSETVQSKQALSNESGKKEKAPAGDPLHKQAAKSDKASKSGGNGFFTPLMAGILGAVLALIGGQFIPKLVTDEEAQTGKLANEISQRVEALELKGSGGAVPEDLVQTIKQLQEQQQGLVAKTAELEAVGQKSEGANVAADNEALTQELAKRDQRLAALEQTIKDLSGASSGEDGAIASVAAISQRVNTIETRVTEQMDQLKQGLSDEMSQKLNLLAETAAKQQSLEEVEAVKLSADNLAQKVAKLTAQVAQMEKLIAAIETHFNTASSSIETQSEALAKHQQNLSDLSKGLDGLRENSVTTASFQSEITPIKEQLELVASDIKALKSSANEAKENARRSALSLALNTLKRAMDSGAPFADELNSVSVLAGEEIDIAALQQFSNEGVPSETTLASQFGPLAQAALDAERRAGANSFLDKLVSNAKSIVKVRRIGEVKGDTSEAIIARIEQRVKAARWEEIAAEAGQLQGVARAKIDPWLQQVAARMKLDQAMQDLEEKIISVLGGQTPQASPKDENTNQTDANEGAN